MEIVEPLESENSQDLFINQDDEQS